MNRWLLLLLLLTIMFIYIVKIEPSMPNVMIDNYA